MPRFGSGSMSGLARAALRYRVPARRAPIGKPPLPNCLASSMVEQETFKSLGCGFESRAIRSVTREPDVSRRRACPGFGPRPVRRSRVSALCRPGYRLMERAQGSGTGICVPARMDATGSEGPPRQAQGPARASSVADIRLSLSGRVYKNVAKNRLFSARITPG